VEDSVRNDQPEWTTWNAAIRVTIPRAIIITRTNQYGLRVMHRLMGFDIQNHQQPAVDRRISVGAIERRGFALQRSGTFYQRDVRTERVPCRKL